MCDVILHCFCIFHLAVNVFLWLSLYAAAAGNNQYMAQLGQRNTTTVLSLRFAADDRMCGHHTAVWRLYQPSSTGR